MRIQARYSDGLPADVTRVEWINITDGWVRLTPAGAFEPVAVPPGCRVQTAESVLERSPTLSAWMEGLELSGRLRRGNG
jgi:hypothetical protein